MIKSNLILTGLLLFYALGPSTAAHADLIIIHDQTFLNSNWDVFKGNGTNFGAVSYFRSAGGGVTGDAQITTASRAAGATSFTYEVEHYKNDAPFTPATQGLIQSIDWQLWYKFQGPSTFGGMQLLAQQGSGYYRSHVTYNEPQNSGPFWQKASGTIAPSTFSLFRGSGPATLDLSSGAQPIEFGYMNSSGVFLNVSSVNYSASFFDLQITASAAVPEPSSYTMVALGLAFIGIVGRCQRRKVSTAGNSIRSQET